MDFIALKVTVIIPVFCVERYIERCCRSLFEQTMNDGIEFIFVDDCSPDKSIEIMQKTLEEYPDRMSQVRVIRHEKNQGQAGSRLSGMMAAQGEYMIHCDSDDWVEPDIYEKLYNKAKETDADVVVCDYIEEYNDRSNQITHQEKNFKPHEILNNISEISLHWCVWSRLIRTSIIKENDIYPWPGINMGEDMGVTLRVYKYAKKIEYVDESLYHYNLTNSNQITRDKSIAINDQLIAGVKLICESFDYDNYSELIYGLKKARKLCELKDHKRFRKTFPEIMTRLRRDKSLSMKFRLYCQLVQWHIPLPNIVKS